MIYKLIIITIYFVAFYFRKKIYTKWIISGKKITAIKQEGNGKESQACETIEIQGNS